MNNLYQPVGAFYHDGSCRFVVWAPLKKSVQLVSLHPEQRIHSLQKDDFGYWSITLPNVQPGFRYKYSVNNEVERPDPASVSQPDGVHEASEVIDRNFNWTDNDWKGLPLDELVIYELHVGTFTTQQTFEGVISKLDYLKDLGINAIEIMPVGQFPGIRNWGYDGVYCYAAQNSYGGSNGLKKLVDAAHQKGIAVILDVVYNHIGPEGGYLSNFAPYFTTRHKTPWGNALNFDDAYCDGVRNYFMQNALMWLNEYHIDGLRMDAVHAIIDYSAKHFVQLLKEKVAGLEEQTGRTKFLIAELDLNNPRYISPAEKGGYELDGQWIDEFHHSLHALLTGETDGYYEDFGTLSHLEKAFRDTFVYNGNYSKHRKKLFGVPADANNYNQFVVFSQNHDHIGNRVLGDRLTAKLSFEQLKMAAAVILLSPYVPLLFMGEEYGEKAPFLYFVSHSDEELIKGVREGRKAEFSYFNFSEDFPDPQSEETLTKSMLTWHMENKESASMLAFYKHLIHFRKSRKALGAKERTSMTVHPANESKVLIIERMNEDDYVLILFNFNNEQTEYKLPVEAAVKKVFDSSSAEWNGSGEVSPAVINAQESFQLNPMSVLIFEQQKA